MESEVHRCPLKTKKVMEKVDPSTNKSIVLFENKSETEVEPSKIKSILEERTLEILSTDIVLHRSLISLRSNDLLWNSNIKTLKKNIVVHKGRRFVRMEPVGRTSLDCKVSAQNYSKICSYEKNFASEYGKTTAVRNSTCNSIILHHKNDASENGLLSPKFSVSSKTTLSRPCNSGKKPETSHSSTSQIVDIFKSSCNDFSGSILRNHKDGYNNVSPTVMYRICYLPEDTCGLSDICEIEPEKDKKNETEFDFHKYHTPIFHSVTDEKANPEIYKFSFGTPNYGVAFKREHSWTNISNASNDECKMMGSINEGILNCQKILNRLEMTYELVLKELSLIHPNRTYADDCLDTQELCMEEDFNKSQFYKSSNEKASILRYRHNIQDTKSSDWQTSMVDLSTIDKVEENERYYFHSNDIQKSNFQINKFLSPTSKLEYSTNSRCGITEFNESEDDFRTILFDASLLLFDSALLHLEDTYETVENEVRSWLLARDVDLIDCCDDSLSQNDGGKIVCDTGKTLTDEHNRFSDRKHLMKFKGRNPDSTGSQYYDCKSSESMGSTFSSSDSDTLESNFFLAKESGSESDLDGSESSLEGSFRNHRPDSRASTSGDDSNDFDDIPHFSLPSRSSNVSRFHSKKTEFLDKVSSREWSWKNGEAEFSVACTQRERCLRSEEHSMNDHDGILKDFSKDHLGIPKQMLQDLNRLVSLNDKLISSDGNEVDNDTR